MADKPPAFIPLPLPSFSDTTPIAAPASPADTVISASLAQQTREVLSTLTPREEDVLRARFGIGEDADEPTDPTLEEVGQDFEVTRERIRQIEAKALRALRSPERSAALQAFVDGSDDELEDEDEDEDADDEDEDADDEDADDDDE